MSATPVKSYEEFTLPPSVVSRVDVARLVHEAEAVDNAMTSASVRAKAGAKKAAAPVLPDMLDEFLTQNKLTLGTSRERSQLIKQLRVFKDKAPVIHMTFAVTADRESLQIVAAWVRAKVHPQAVLSVGLQPALVAGVYVRTPNHVHDLSLRSLLENSRGLLQQEVEALRGSK